MEEAEEAEEAGGALLLLIIGLIIIGHQLSRVVSVVMVPVDRGRERLAVRLAVLRLLLEEVKTKQMAVVGFLFLRDARE